MKKNKWLALINIPFQMGITIFLFIKLGIYLDEKYQMNKVCTLIGTLLGISISLYFVIKQVNKINNDQ